jgi:hypothetical protein
VENSNLGNISRNGKYDTETKRRLRGCASEAETPPRKAGLRKTSQGSARLRKNDKKRQETYKKRHKNNTPQEFSSLKGETSLRYACGKFKQLRGSAAPRLKRDCARLRFADYTDFTVFDF